MLAKAWRLVAALLAMIGVRRMTKDRSAHEAARGVKMPSLKDLIGARPTEEQLDNYHELINAESDRGSAIMAAALVENSLELVIRSSIIDPGETTGKAWFNSPGAPFGSFSAKIALGRAIAIYGPETQSRLDSIKEIRNAFAHASIPLDFSYAPFKSLCLKLTPDPKKFKDRRPKILFAATCMSLSRILIGEAIKRGGKEITVPLP